MEAVKIIRDALLSVSDNVGHFEQLKAKDPYIVLREHSAGHNHSDNHVSEQSIMGTIDLFTKTEFEPLVEKIQAALNLVDCAWYLNTIQYENDTGYTHYEWVWEVANVED